MGNFSIRIHQDPLNIDSILDRITSDGSSTSRTRTFGTPDSTEYNIGRGVGEGSLQTRDDYSLVGSFRLETNAPFLSDVNDDDDILIYRNINNFGVFNVDSVSGLSDNVTFLSGRGTVSAAGNPAVIYKDGNDVTVQDFVDAILPIAPTIVEQPQNRLVERGFPTNFLVTAEGTNPFSYQWQFNGSASGGTFSNIANTASITGTQDHTLSIQGAATQTITSGTRFRCIVTNTAGTVTSNEAVLTLF